MTLRACGWYADAMCRMAIIGVVAACVLVAGCRADRTENRSVKGSAAAAAGSEERVSPGLHFQTWQDVSGQHRYALYVPQEAIAKPPYPLVVFLHGYGECGTDGVKQTSVGLIPAVLNAPERWPCVVLAPQKVEFDALWESEASTVMREIEMVKEMMAIDASRIVLTGLSQGGNGTWVLGGKAAGTWAGLAPVCGFHRAIPAAEMARAIGNDVPVWAFHGLKDTVVPPQETRDVVAALKDVRAGGGGEVKLTEFPNADHNSWDSAYRNKDVAAWMMARRKR